MAYIELEGLPETNAEIRAGRALQYFVNAHRDPKTSKVGYELKEFLPDWIAMGDGPDDEEEQEIDPVTAQRASEKMASLGGMFR